ncbi:peroxidase-like [Sipha flava]|uniref:Peroxidase-like n=1 Tax=Sipha flava TaxID=143950 RepID=A0A8B8G465_9HEMI|nr:peroxidase-like [Sipha flava]
MLFLSSLVCILSFCVTSIPPSQARISEFDFKNTVVIDNTFYQSCATAVTCDPSSKYRTINGSCNNLLNPLWGSSGTPYIRLGSAFFADGDHQIRFQSSGNKLPGPRELQLAISTISPNIIDVPEITNVHFTQMGQWLAHDITLMSPDLSGPSDCCAIQNSDDIPPQCQAVITIDPMDQVYLMFDVPRRSCLSFRRAMTTTLNFNCSITPQIPINQATAFVDASQLYGHNNIKAASLRSNVDGKLKTEMINGQRFCVQQKRNSTFCDGRDNVCVCFDHGDVRNNQNLGIIIYGELFLRLHNHIADSLKLINPNWTDEILYEEARKIVIALNQIFVYRDYLPLLFGEDYSENSGLTLSKFKRTVYDESLMPQVSTELSAGSFRVPHNIINTYYSLVDENNKVLNVLKLHEFMMFPDIIVENKNLEYILRGMSLNSSRYPVASYNLGISNFMFHNMIKNIADSDLLATDIQRGRDVGIPPYIKVRELCGFSVITSFDDLLKILSPTAIGLLKLYYEDVASIDLIVGSLLEPIIPGAWFGETTRCILADGFYRIRYGDRFFCDVQDQPGSFTDEQFEVLWNLNLTQIFCAMSKIDQLPSNFFMSYGNSEMIDCEELSLDLQLWRHSTNG